jgi:hypothetical protein
MCVKTGKDILPRRIAVRQNTDRSRQNGNDVERSRVLAKSFTSFTHPRKSGPPRVCRRIVIKLTFTGIRPRPRG